MIDGFPFESESGILHDRIIKFLEYGMPPELIEDMGKKADSDNQCIALLDMLAEKLGCTEEAREWKRCLKIAKGNQAFAETLYRMGKSSGEDHA